ncbi:MAG: hotdog fold thioesterase [Gammaproteobacteria bacterium]|nr:hotdog fold thioesterase [Gammaproteobacteria bacterium]
MNPKTINEFLRQSMPSAGDMDITCTEVDANRAVVHWEYGPRWLRPGNYISGPLLMTMADTALYCAVFGNLDRIEPMAVTSELATHFLRPAVDSGVTATATLIEVTGRRAYGEVRMVLDTNQILVAHATGTYILPK